MINGFERRSYKETKSIIKKNLSFVLFFFVFVFSCFVLPSVVTPWQDSCSVVMMHSYSGVVPHQVAISTEIGMCHRGRWSHWTGRHGKCSSLRQVLVTSRHFWQFAPTFVAGCCQACSTHNTGLFKECVHQTAVELLLTHVDHSCLALFTLLSHTCGVISPGYKVFQARFQQVSL